MEGAEAGVRKASKEETAGDFAPAMVSVYGDLARVLGLISPLRIGTTTERAPTPVLVALGAVEVVISY